MNLPIVGITMGDPTGIGPEITVKALGTKEPFAVCRPVVFGDQRVLLRTIDLLGLSTSVEVIERVPEEGYQPHRIFLRSLSELELTSLRPGKPDRPCGEAMVKYVEEAVRWVLDGKLNAITTCPINKQAINEAGHFFAGHTELLAHLTKSSSVAMMFLSPGVSVVLVTTHLPLKDIPEWIKKDRILSTIRVTVDGVKKYFGISRPKIAVLGLNPHCGEEGLLGEEETKEIVPAIEEARSNGLEVDGPFPADSFFGLSGHHSRYDVVIPMYHDQGLIPIKMSDYRKSVNFTLGLPFVRTSVAHGTAYDIAGKGVADPTNLVHAVEMAAKLSKFQGV